MYVCLEFQTLHTRPGTSCKCMHKLSLEFGELTFLSKLFRMSLRKEGGVQQGSNSLKLLAPTMYLQID